MIQEISFISACLAINLNEYLAHFNILARTKLISELALLVYKDLRDCNVELYPATAQKNILDSAKELLLTNYNIDVNREGATENNENITETE